MAPIVVHGVDDVLADGSGTRILGPATRKASVQLRSAAYAHSNATRIMMNKESIHAQTPALPRRRREGNSNSYTPGLFLESQTLVHVFTPLRKKRKK